MEIKDFEPLWDCWYVKEYLGEGSFGKVYRIERNEFGNTYTAALKHLRIPQSQSEVKSILAEGMSIYEVEKYFEKFVKDIVRECELMSKLKGNSHIVSYEDHKFIKAKDEICWDIFIRMELLTSLIDYIQENTISKRDIIKLGIDICKALELCQKHNIIHRDIKPENIFVSENGDFKLGDFGIARQMEATVANMSKKGAYPYIAPEVYKDEKYGSTVDIYSLGIVMYRLLNNNRLPFMPAYPNPISHLDREIALAKRISGEAIEPPVNSTGRLTEIVLKACAYEPKDRYHSPIVMRMDLEAILYDSAEANVIYPEGDTAEIKSIDYIKTQNEETKAINASVDFDEAKIELMSTQISEFLQKQTDENLTDNKLYRQIKNDNEENVSSYTSFDNKNIENTLENATQKDHTNKQRKNNYILTGKNSKKKVVVAGIGAVVLAGAVVLGVSSHNKGSDTINTTDETKQTVDVNEEKSSVVLEAFDTIENSNLYYPYLLYDIDKDGVDELIMGTVGKTDYAIDIFKYVENEPIKLGTVETYINPFENKYLFKNDEGVGLVKKIVSDSATDVEYGIWTIDNDGVLQYKLCASSHRGNSTGSAIYTVENNTVDEEKYNEYIRNLAAEKIENYVPERESMPTTTETVTQVQHEVQTEAYTEVQTEAITQAKVKASQTQAQTQAAQQKSATQSSQNTNSNGVSQQTQSTQQQPVQKSETQVQQNTQKQEPVTQPPVQKEEPQQSEPAQSSSSGEDSNGSVDTYELPPLPPIVMDFD